MTDPQTDTGTPAGADEAVDLPCSARGCRADATWAVRWNNPRIHTPERRKVWLACPDHRQHLETYLSARDLYRDTVPVTGLGEPDGPGATPQAP